MTWRDTRKQLRKDHRWDLTDSLEREEKEKLFETHIDGLFKRNRGMFHSLLDETDVRSLKLYFYLLWTGRSVYFENLFSIFVKKPGTFNI